MLLTAPHTNQTPDQTAKPQTRKSFKVQETKSMKCTVYSVDRTTAERLNETESCGHSEQRFPGAHGLKRTPGQSAHASH